MASSSDALIEDNRSSSSIFSTKVLLKSDPKKKLDHDNNNDDDNDNASVSSDGSFDLLTEFRKSRNNNNQNQNTNNDKPSQQQQQQQQQQVAVKEQQQQQDTSPPPPPPPPSSMEALKCSSLFTSSSEEDDDDEEEEEEEVESNRHNRIEKEKPKKHIRWRTNDDDDDDDYDYDYDTKKYNYNDKENRTFSSSSSSSPNRKKRESPSKSKKKNKNKNNTNISPVKTTKKSYGISPLSFHRHKINNNNDDNNNDNIWKDEFHQSVADKVLLQEKQEYRTELEQQRKIFKKKTCMKRWPVQQMAMDHLYHLLSPNSANKQYHGGEYMSGESSSGSSISSSEEKKIRRIISSARAAASSSSSSSSDDNNDDDGDGDENENDQKPKAAAAPKSSSSQDQDIVIDTDEPLWSMEPRIFATEKAQGKRKYLVGHFGRIADWYWRKSDATNKHLYEVIRENTPCRLYFDLEYSKMYNTDIDSQRLLDEFLIEIKTDLQQYYNIQFKNHQLIDLDSSTDVKFSKHWIFDFDSQGLFEDAPCVGRFVKRLVGRLAEELATGVLATKGHTELAKNLFVQTKDSIKDNSDGTKSSNSKPTCFVDLGVYTKNRLFRVLGSSKFGKTVSLQPSTTNLYPNIELPKKQQQQRQQQVSSSPETTTTSPKAAITDLTTIEDYIKANDWCPHARALANTLVIPLKETKASGDGDTSGYDKGENRRILTVADDEASRYRPRGSGGASKTTIRTLGVRRSVAESFLPSLDQYVFDVLSTRGDVQGTIRAVSVEYGGANNDEPISITYQLSRNRYCELIGRQHKSNNVYWTISDLGTTWTCIQGCHDPDCFGRGCPITISKNDKHYPAIEKEWQSFQEEQFENALLALNMDDITNIANNDDDDDESSKNRMNNVQKEEENEQSHATNSYAEEAKEKRNRETSAGDGDDEYGLSDTALLEAALSNPELFP